MTKFCLSESESVIASLRDPVALDCISKLAQNAADTTAGTQQMEEDGSVSVLTQELTPSSKDGVGSVSLINQEPVPTPKKEDATVSVLTQEVTPSPNTINLTMQELTPLPKDENNTVGLVTQELMPMPKGGYLMSCPVNQDVSTILPPKDGCLTTCRVNQDLSAIAPLTVTDASNYGIKLISESVGTASQQMSAGSDIPLLIASHDLLSLPLITLPLVACSAADISTLNQAAGSDKSFVTVAAVSELNSLPENMAIKPAYRTL